MTAPCISDRLRWAAEKAEPDMKKLLTDAGEAINTLFNHVDALDRATVRVMETRASDVASVSKALAHLSSERERVHADIWKPYRRGE